MAHLPNILQRMDFIAVGMFFLFWLVFEYVIDFSQLNRKSLSGLMANKRRQWMRVLAERELRIVDASILNGLQQGSAFFASTSILAIGGCYALLGATDQVLEIYSNLPVDSTLNPLIWELKLILLSGIFAYSFFKFGWSYRLFNYCAILIGCVPQPEMADLEERRKYAAEAAEINIIAGRHFTSGLRGIFFSVAYLGWFFGPWVFICMTVLVSVVLVRRQFFSRARASLLSSAFKD